MILISATAHGISKPSPNAPAPPADVPVCGGFCAAQLAVIVTLKPSVGVGLKENVFPTPK